MGRLIVIEGVDSSGKQTQAKLLYERLVKEGENVKLISFPDYESDFCVPIKRYLAGDLGSNPNDVNAYAASVFYAIDRYASFKRKWGEFYKNGGTIIADRYVTSNLVHQASKIKGDKSGFISWLSDLEYDKMELPVPDVVVFLDMPPKYAQMLMKDRANKITGEKEKDIHESNKDYLIRSYENAMEIAKICNWNILSCVSENSVRSIENINDDIYNLCKK
ncbi:MAG: thymidylate kinase [Clostridia bacterium]|nr:thymidylate kinase [Clostridia bacterium]